MNEARKTHRLEVGTVNKYGYLSVSTCTGCDWTSCAGSTGTASAAHKRHVKAMAKKAVA